MSEGGREGGFEEEERCVRCGFVIVYSLVMCKIA